MAALIDRGFSYRWLVRTPRHHSALVTPTIHVFVNFWISGFNIAESIEEDSHFLFSGDYT